MRRQVVNFERPGAGLILLQHHLGRLLGVSMGDPADSIQPDACQGLQLSFFKGHLPTEIGNVAIGWDCAGRTERWRVRSRSQESLHACGFGPQVSSFMPGKLVDCGIAFLQCFID